VLHRVHADSLIEIREYDKSIHSSLNQLNGFGISVAAVCKNQKSSAIFCFWYGMVQYHTIGTVLLFQLMLAPTRHLGANKGYASKHLYFIIKTHTLLSTTKSLAKKEESRQAVANFSWCCQGCRAYHHQKN